MRSSITIVALFVVACAAAGNYTVDPSTIDTTDKATWCNSQFNTCTSLCNAGGGGTKVDTCDSDTLDYVCTCNNGTAPGLAYYTNSMDTILCQQSFELCIEANVGDSAGQAACKTDIQDTCGTLDPNNATASTSSETSSTASGTATGSSSSATGTSSSGAVPANVHHYGKAAGAVAIGLLAYML